MTDADLPTPPSEPDFDAPEPTPPDIDKLFPMIPQNDLSPLDDQDEQEDQVEQEEPPEEQYEPITSDDDETPTVNAAEPEPAPQKAPPPEPAGPTAIVRYGLMGFLGEFRYNLKRPIRPGNKVVIRTDRGVELGEVILLVNRSGSEDTGDICPAGTYISHEFLSRFLKNSSENYPLRRGGRVLRIANQQDLIDYRHLSTSADEESKYCRQQIEERNLPMHLVKAEHMLGGERIVFYFTAESRVDFRSLVRDLASQFRTRIEMRQVGARDEARLVADYERCGRPCCCREFLKDLKPVSMRMAKVQKATLDPTKISGRCGRLMCCLRYEDDCYEELKKSLPKRNTWVKTKTHLGCVVDGQIITQLVRLALYDGTFAVVPVEDILERDLEPPTEEELRDHAAKQAIAQRNEARKAAEEAQIALIPPPATDDTPSKAEEETPAEPAAENVEPSADTTKKKRRRRRRKKSSGDPKAAQPKDNEKNRQDTSPPKGKQKKEPSSGAGGEKRRSGKKRRGRRRRKKPNAGGQGHQGGSGGGS